MITQFSDANKVITDGRVAQYSATPVTNTVNGIRYTVAWEITRSATMTYSYVGMTEAAAKACADALRASLTRRYADWEVELLASSDALKPNVVISPVWRYECTANVRPTLSDGTMWSVEVSENDTDTVVTTEEITDAAQMESLFQAAIARDYPTSTDHIEIESAEWKSNSSRIYVNFTQSIANFNKLNLGADIWNGSAWAPATVTNRTEKSLQITDVTDNKKIRLNYNSGTVTSPEWTTRNNLEPSIVIHSAKLRFSAGNQILNYATLTVRFSWDADPLQLSLGVAPHGSTDFSFTKMPINYPSPVDGIYEVPFPFGSTHDDFDICLNGGGALSNIVRVTQQPFVFIGDPYVDEVSGTIGVDFSTSLSAVEISTLTFWQIGKRSLAYTPWMDPLSNLSVVKQEHYSATASYRNAPENRHATFQLSYEDANGERIYSKIFYATLPAVAQNAIVINMSAMDAGFHQFGILDTSGAYYITARVSVNGGEFVSSTQQASAALSVTVPTGVTSATVAMVVTSPKAVIGSNFIVPSMWQNLSALTVADAFTSISDSAFANFTGVIIMSGRTRAQVQAMTNYPFGLAGGATVQCTDGNIVIS